MFHSGGPVCLLFTLILRYILPLPATWHSRGLGAGATAFNMRTRCARQGEQRLKRWMRWPFFSLYSSMLFVAFVQVQWWSTFVVVLCSDAFVEFCRFICSFIRGTFVLQLCLLFLYLYVPCDFWYILFRHLPFCHLRTICIHILPVHCHSIQVHYVPILPLHSVPTIYSAFRPHLPSMLHLPFHRHLPFILLLGVLLLHFTAATDDNRHYHLTICHSLMTDDFISSIVDTWTHCCLFSYCWWENWLFCIGSDLHCCGKFLLTVWCIGRRSGSMSYDALPSVEAFIHCGDACHSCLIRYTILVCLPLYSLPEPWKALSFYTGSKFIRDVCIDVCILVKYSTDTFWWWYSMMWYLPSDTNPVLLPFTCCSYSVPVFCCSFCW